MKRLQLFAIGAVPVLVVSYRPSMYWAGVPVGACYAERTYRKITGSTLNRLLRHSTGLTRTIHYVTDERTGTEITILEIKNKVGSK